MKNAVEICRKNCRSANHVTSFGEMTSLVTFFPFYHSKRELTGRLMLVAEKPGPVRSEDESPGRCRSEVGSQPAVHSNQCPGHPLPLLPTHVPGPQGWD